jgi:hypothetical protein
MHEWGDMACKRQPRSRKAPWLLARSVHVVPVAGLPVECCCWAQVGAKSRAMGAVGIAGM